MTTDGKTSLDREVKKELKRLGKLAKHAAMKEDKRIRKEKRHYEKLDPLYIRFVNSSDSYQDSFLPYVQSTLGSDFTGYKFQPLPYNTLGDVVESIDIASEEKKLDVLVIEDSQEVRENMKDILGWTDMIKEKNTLQVCFLYDGKKKPKEYLHSGMYLINLEDQLLAVEQLTVFRAEKTKQNYMI